MTRALEEVGHGQMAQEKQRARTVVSQAKCILLMGRVRYIHTQLCSIYIR